MTQYQSKLQEEDLSGCLANQSARGKQPVASIAGIQIEQNKGAQSGINAGDATFARTDTKFQKTRRQVLSSSQPELSIGVGAKSNSKSKAVMSRKSKIELIPTN
jgi:hypothetical protein